MITDDRATTVDPDGAAGTRSADESLGCDVQVVGTIRRQHDRRRQPRHCARVAKAIFGQQAGAAAVVMVNNDTGLPPVEGPITSNPDTGVPYNVTIPFLGVRAPDQPASDGGSAPRRRRPAATVTPVLDREPELQGLRELLSAVPAPVTAA